MSSLPTPAETVSFGEFEANLRSRELLKQGSRVRLPDQSFQILAMLLESPGELVTREEIKKRLWPGDTFVDFDHGLNNAVNRLREALGDSADAARLIETLPRRGYRFVGRANTAKDVPLSKQESDGISSQNAIHNGTIRHEGEARIRSHHRWLILAGLLILVPCLVVVFQFRRRSTPLSSRLFVLPPAGATFNLIGDDGGSVALSPDGTRIAFVAVNSRGTAQVWVRALGKLAPDAIDGTEGASFPFWSPDGNSIGFFSQGKLIAVASDGRTSPRIVCEAPFGRGGSWNSQGVIIFAPESHSGIYRVADSGGTPVLITTVDPSMHTSHRWPKFLPDGKHFLYLAVSHFQPAAHNGIYLGSLEGKQDKWIVSTDADATYASGYLFFLRKDLFMAQRFDLDSAQLQGEAQPTPERVLYDPTIWKAVFDVSDQGVMAYQLGDRVRGNQYYWFDRKGKNLGALGGTAFQEEPTISPDGRRLVAGINEGGYSKLWIYDLDGGRRMQITFSKYDSSSPIWSNDSSAVLFAGKRQHYSIFQVSGGVEREHLVLDTGKDTWPLDLSSDGRFLLYGEGLYIGRVQSQLWVYPMDGAGSPFRLLDTEGVTASGQFSADGRWVAYDSNESGRNEVYVVPFDPNHARRSSSLGKWQLSISGGRWPRWRRDSKELFYLSSDNTMMAVPLTIRGSEFTAGVPHALFHVNPGYYNISYDVSPNGSKFIINTAAEERAAPITIVENWLSDLAK